jgi:predicted enzyme related to lactoylglutathione lyase
MKAYNPVTWFEIYVDDMERAQQFYETVFDQKMSDMDVPGDASMKMVSFPWAENSINAAGALVHTPQMKAGGNSTIVYFQSDDCLTEQNRVEAAGGKIIQPKFSIGEHGFYALCMDTEGNNFGLYSLK